VSQHDASHAASSNVRADSAQSRIAAAEEERPRSSGAELVSLDAPAGSGDEGSRTPVLDFVAGDGWRPDVTVEAHTGLQRVQAAVAHLEQAMLERLRALVADAGEPSLRTAA
jgi:hypothetical protein